MTPEQKIAEIVKKIKDEAAINPNPEWMKFDFNYHMGGFEVLSESEERRILFKLRKEKAIELHLSQFEDDEPKEVGVISSEEAGKFSSSPYYWVKILDGFEEKCKNYLLHLEPKEPKNKKNSPKKSLENTKTPLNVKGDYVAGDKVGRDKNTNSRPGSLWDKYWWRLFMPVAAGLIIFAITQNKIPQPVKIPIDNLNSVEDNSISTSTVNILDILSKRSDFNTSLERQNFLENYKESEVYGEGSFNDISKTRETYYVYTLIEKYPVACSFDASPENEKKLLLLKDGDNVSFSGVFTGSNLNGIAWYVENCILLD